MTTEEEKAIGARFKTFRKEYIKTSQDDLAKELSTTQREISFYENGVRQPSHKAMSILSRKYKLNPQWLLSGLDGPTTDKKYDEGSIPSMQASIALLQKEVRELREIILEIQSKLQEP